MGAREWKMRRDGRGLGGRWAWSRRRTGVVRAQALVSALRQPAGQTAHTDSLSCGKQDRPDI